MNILLVEDDAGLVELITENMEELGFSLMSAASGAEAFTCLKKQTPDLLLLDYSLPDINGKELIETLNTQQTPPPPFIITTGQGDESIAVNMMKLGAKDYLVKDILFLEKLPNVIKRVVKEIESDGKLKQAEEAFKESEARIRQFTQNVPDYLLQIDKTGIINYINKTYEGLTQKDIVGTSVYSWIPNESSKLFKDKVEKVFKYGGNEIIEYPSEGPKGEPIWFETNIGPLEKSGTITQVIIVARDITERKQTEKILHEQKKAMERTESIAKLGGWSVDLKTMTPYLSKQIREISELDSSNAPSLEEGIKFYAPEDRPKFEQAFNECMKTGKPYDLELRYITAKGNKRWVRATGRAEKENGAIVKLSGLLQDITDKKQADDALKESEERFELAMKATQDGLYDWDLETNEIYYSPGWKSMLGYNDDELPNNVSVLEKLAKPEDLEAAYAMRKEVISKQRDRFELELKMKHKDGHWVDILSRAEAVFDKSGKAIRIVGTHVDISERKHEEKILDVELKLFEYAINHSEEELLQKFLNEAEKLTDSNIGFYHYVEDDQESISLQTWSSNTLNNMCKGLGEATRHYPISKAGVWVDCIKERKPVVHNDYSGLTHKKGLPEGHAPIIRELVVPVIRGNQIMAVLGVGNKKSDYNETDVKSIQRLADVAWETVVRKQAEEKILIAEKNLQNTFDISPSIIAKVNLNTGYFVEVNQALTRILGYTVKEFTSKPFLEFVHPDTRQKTADKVSEKLTLNQETYFENRYLCKDGSSKWMSWNATKVDTNGIVTAIGSDITEHKLAESKLKQSTLLLETSQSIAKLGGWELDIATNELFWTAETYRIHDTSPEEFNPTVDAGVGYFLPESRRIISDALKAAIENGEGYDLILETYTTKGRLIDVRTTCEVTVIDGKPIKLTGIFQDITEQKKSEELIKESKEKYKSLYDNAPLSYHSLDGDGTFLDINPCWLETLGYERSEVIGENYVDFLHPDWKEIFTKNFPKLKNRGYVHDVPFKIRHKNGHYIDISLNGQIGTNSDGSFKQTYCVFKDITAQNLADENKRIAEKNLQNTFDLSPSIICTGDLKINKIISVNKIVTKILGYSVDEFIANPFGEFTHVHPDDKKGTKKALKKLISGTDVISYENRFKCKDGSYKWMIWNVSIDDEKRFITAIGSDISKRKIIEQEIVETKQFYENITEGVQDGIWVTDKNDVIFYANLAMEKIAGVSREQIQGKNVLKDFPKETIGEFSKFYKQAKKEKKPVWYVIKAKTPGNKNVFQNGWLIPQYKNKAYTGVICTVRDISVRKEAEGSVRRLSTAVEQSPSIVVITDPKGKVEYVNPKFTELTGYSSTEAIGQKSNILKSGEQDTQFYEELWETVLSEKVWRGQFRNKKKNGELFWEAASISAILNDSGAIINFIKIGEDITQQKNTESKLKTALEKAMESDRLKSAFLANMSHEIRTPMNGILGFINLLNEPNLTKSQIDSYSKIINKSGYRLLNTINDIIDISKIEAGQMQVSETETCINKLLNELYSFHSPEANQKGLSLFFSPSLSNEQANIITDSNKLHGILTNLVKNAIKFTEKGTISFGYLLKKNFIEFFVEDTGSGIPKNRIHAIFNRFEQADIEDVRVMEGSGLGLAITKAYVTMLGGEISVKSEEDKGSKFVFTIPYIQKSEEEVVEFVENIDTGSKEINKLNLLIVEDDEVSAELLKYTLEGIFKEITFVDNGKVAIETCRDNPEIDLVLMDIKIPIINGYDATKEIRKFNKDVLIIAQTAYAMPGDREKAIEYGCNDYITKPINETLLLEIINKLLDS